VTAGPQEDQRAANAQAAGEAAEAKHTADALAQHQASGSAVVVEDVATPDDVSVGWFGSGSNAAQPTLRPSEPAPVGQQGNHGPPDVA
jgi:hypothetical protein